MKKLASGLALSVLAVLSALSTQAYAVCGPHLLGCPYGLTPVSDSENLPDSGTGFGAVSYSYQIGVGDVTIEQYADFLNSVAQTDPYGLYNPLMGSVPNVAGISRSGESGDYSYSAMGSSWNKPVTSVSWFNAARFANWMANGQPTGSEDSTTTENGAYDLTDFDRGVNKIAPAKNLQNPNENNQAPTYYIPTENEWYKAAYYDPCHGGSGGYYLYATKSNTLPGNMVGGEANQANYLSETSGYSVTQSPDFSSTAGYLTDVGAFTSSESYYGTYDQTGDVWEWNDLDGTASLIKGLRGGAYTSTAPYIQSTYRMGYVATSSNPNGGFRLAGPALGLEAPHYSGC